MEAPAYGGQARYGLSWRRWNRVRAKVLLMLDLVEVLGKCTSPNWCLILTPEGANILDLVIYCWTWTEVAGLGLGKMYKSKIVSGINTRGQ